MSLLTSAWAEEFKNDGIAANSLWPATLIATAAVKNLLGGEKLFQVSRKPEIMADAAFYLLKKIQNPPPVIISLMKTCFAVKE